MEEANTVLMMITYNRLELTKKTIDFLLTSTNHPFYLVIVDNGSTDGTVEYLNKLQVSGPMKNIDLILLNQNKGIAVGRNIALKKADEYNPLWYCTIDNDVQLPNGWLEKCIDILEKNKAYGAIGVNFEPSAYPLVTKNGCTFQNKPQGNLGTACMVFRKQVHQMLGFFTTEYGLYGEEDSDYGMRMRVANFQLGYLEEMGIHLGSDEQDVGEYRKFKTREHDAHLKAFQNNCALYFRRQKPIYIAYKG